MKTKIIFLSIISVILLFLMPTYGEIMYKVDQGKISKFPAPKLPENWEPPDWKDYPWFQWWKPETFDPNQPHAAEKIWWVNKDNFDAGFAYTVLSPLTDENRFGHVRNITGTRAAIFLSQPGFQDLLSYNEGKIKAGDSEFKSVITFFSPPQIRGLSSLTWKYLESPGVKREQDRWTYVPALRRTRRLAAGADDDKLAGTDFTVDDVGEREVWEEEHILIGEDILTPDDFSMYHFTYKGYPKEHFAIAPLPKQIDCWVVLSVNRKPKYYFPKRVTWFDKRNLIGVREEQYDFHDTLWKIYEWGWGNFTNKYRVKSTQKYVNPKYGTGYVEYRNPSFTQVWDIKINHMTVKANLIPKYDQNSFLGWTGEGSPPHSFFDVKRMEREEWGEPLPQPARLKNIREWLPPPKLLKERFKPYRNIVLPEEIEKKLIQEYGE